MDHNCDAGELSLGSTDDEGDSTPAIVLNTQSNLFTFTVSVRTYKLNKQKNSTGKSGFSMARREIITHLKSDFFYTRVIGLNGNLPSPLL